MSLLLDALNRASKEKQKAAAAAAQAQSPAVAPAQSQSALPVPVPPVPMAISPDFSNVPAQALKWEEVPHPTPDPLPVASAERYREEPPVLMTPVQHTSDLELTLVDGPPTAATPTTSTRLESSPSPELSSLPAVPSLVPEPAQHAREPTLAVTPEPTLEATLAAQPDLSPAAPVVPTTAPVPAASTPREPTLEAPVTPPPPPAPVSRSPPVSMHAPTPAAPAPALSLTQASTSVPDGQMAQDIRRAYEGPSSDARKVRRSAMALGGLAVGLALAFGSVFLGLWGDPAQWLGGPGVSNVAPPPPIAIEEPAALAKAGSPTEAAAPGAVTTAQAPAAVAAASASAPSPAPAPVAMSGQTPAAPSEKPVRTAKTAASGQAAPAAPSAKPAPPDAPPQSALGAAPATNAVAPPGIATASPAATGNEVVLRANARANPNFVAKTRGPSALEQGYALLLEGRMDDAAAAYGQALRANADERDALLGMAYISQKKGLREDAQTYYRQVLRQEPNNPRALAGLQALDSGSDTTLTASRAGDLASRQPDSAAAMAMAGNAFVRDGLLSNAAQAYARAQLLEPANPLHAYNLAVALDRLGRFAAAAVQYERVLALSAKAPVAERAFQINDVRLRLAQLHQALAATEPAAP